MSLQRWGLAFLQLGALLLAIGLLPAAFMAIFLPSTPALIPALLSVSVAPPGAVCFTAGLLIWGIGLVRR
ncbi:hypothetical protein NO932_13850 [Pelagibacterium sp. 26DY04]|uniref:hypothetical protein n=1 Tax=unclassified Pelagibacterium TaxID=2623280 RepID=UPI0028168249|nr:MULTISPECIES: hypothetical protein [unclassified Pelagibacterium]WMT86001.1 hypothetical protein NO932_13850 [Pelagibacterium sp. 26DY04]WMT89714.1 hypothetical protein NO934_13040 [Pelagibacterium sp. H642]